MAVDEKARAGSRIPNRISDKDLHTCSHIHMVGIAGSGMSSLAAVLAGWGYRLSGSDANIEQAAPLGRLGISLFQGHRAALLPAEAEAVVFSDAVPRNNPELLRAAQLGLPILSYFQALGQMCRSQRTIAIAGTHGKSTTTAMLGHLLAQAGEDPTIFCGARPLGGGLGGRAGGRQVMVAEACEYRENFLHLAPQAAALLNIEDDHFDFYRSPEQLDFAFASFVQKLPANGLLLVRQDCPRAIEAARTAGCRVETFGLDKGADWAGAELKEHNGRYQLEILRAGKPWGQIRLPIPGLHNAFNALAAAGLGAWCGLSAQQVTSGLATFPGLHRRLERVGRWGGAEWIDDYAHHPTEVGAALSAVREVYPRQRLWTVFQPHQASRTARLLDEFAASLDNSDRLFIAEIFRAREGRLQPGEVTAEDLAERVRARGGRVPPVHGLDAISQWLSLRLGAGDVLLTLGAGDVRRVGSGWIHSLSRDGMRHDLDYRFREDRAAG